MCKAEAEEKRAKREAAAEERRLQAKREAVAEKEKAKQEAKERRAEREAEERKVALRLIRMAETGVRSQEAANCSSTHGDRQRSGTVKC